MNARALLVVTLVAVGLAGWWASREERPGPPPEAGAPPGGERAASRAGGTENGAPGEVPLAARGPEFASAGTAPRAGTAAVAANVEGVRALEAGDLEGAVAAFERALRLGPDESVFRANLAEALARRARAVREESLAPALLLLTRARELAPERADLARLHERWSRESRAEQGFSAFESPYFELSFDGSRTELLHASQRFLDRLEAAYTDLQEWFRHDPVLAGRPPFPVRLYRPEPFDEVTGLGHWAAGAFDGTIRLPLEEDDVADGRWGRTLRHELVHAFVREVGGDDVPAWLNEGLAQWLEGDPREAVAAARRRLRGTEPFPLAELRTSLARWRDADRLRRAYDQSLVLVARLAEDYGEDVLLALVQSDDPATELERRAGVSLDAVLADALRGG